MPARGRRHAASRKHSQPGLVLTITGARLRALSLYGSNCTFHAAAPRLAPSPALVSPRQDMRGHTLSPRYPPGVETVSSRRRATGMLGDTPIRSFPIHPRRVTLCAARGRIALARPLRSALVLAYTACRTSCISTHARRAHALPDARSASISDLLHGPSPGRMPPRACLAWY